MSESWRRVTWGSVCDLKYGKALSGYRDNVGSTEVFGTNGPVGWTTSTPLGTGPRPIVGRKGAYRGIHLARGDFWVIDTAYWLEPTADLDPTWAYYALLLVDINGMDSGSAIPSLTRDHFRALPLHLPPIDEQRRVAGVLGTLDDLIELNRSVLRDLDALFVASWRGAASRVTERCPLGQIITVAKGLSYKGVFLTDSGLPLVNMGNFGIDGTFRDAGLKWYVEAEVKDRHRLSRGDLVVVNTDLTQSRDILARPIIVPFDAATSSHHTFQVDVAGGEAQRYWVYGALRDESIRKQLIAYATGTTVAALPLDALTSQMIPWPGASRIEDWWTRTEALFLSQESLKREIQELTATLEELLPLLMSGRVQARDGAA